jgi:hypothetical protein
MVPKSSVRLRCDVDEEILTEIANVEWYILVPAGSSTDTVKVNAGGNGKSPEGGNV